MKSEQTIPEAKETLEWQFAQLKMGHRKAVMIPAGNISPVQGAHGHPYTKIPSGTVYYDPSKISPEQIQAAWASNMLGDVLGYGTPSKPDPKDGGDAVTIRGRNGKEKQSVEVDEYSFEPVIRQAQKTKGPDDAITVEPTEKVLEERLEALDSKKLKILPLAGNSVLAGQTLASARADNHEPLRPTHAIVRGKKVVGYVCIDSIPLCRVWMDSKSTKAPDSMRVFEQLENVYRMKGQDILATIMNEESPFYPHYPRLGWVEARGDRLLMKKL